MDSRIRVRYTKGEQVKYISHLDMMKAFERALRRSGAPVAYSRGFNPHPGMVFGLPLSVGVTSENEYADFETDGSITPEEFMESLNGSLPDGIRLTAAEALESPGNIMGLITAASYTCLLCPGSGISKGATFKETILPTNGSVQGDGSRAASGAVLGALKEKAALFMSLPHIITDKEGKNGTKAVDIRPMIREFELLSTAEAEATAAEKADTRARYVLEYAKGLGDDVIPPLRCGFDDFIVAFLLLSAGSVSNLKPELMLAAFGRFADREAFEVLAIHRTGLFGGFAGSPRKFMGI